MVLSPAIWRPLVNEAMEEDWFGEPSQDALSFWVNHFEAWNNKRTLTRLAEASSPGHRLLEIGVGSGSFLTAARQTGYEVMGCDLSASICQRVRHTYHIPMHGGHLTALAGESRFDVVVMNHVLEHVDQPIELLRDVHRLLSPRGIVHIAVPNIGCWEAWLPGWTSYEPYHLAYFTPQTLKRVVFASGLAIEHLATHESFSGWFLAVLRSALRVNQAGGAVTRPPITSARYAKASRPKLLEHAYRLAMVCSGAALWPLRMAQEQLGRGDEAICIARKLPLASAR
jgi:2-polyprenyl-3-methyl-5-hydroxy-6-metoxy-1,4-benzoquinol methylase